MGSHALTILTYHSLDTSGSVVSVAPHVFSEQMTWMSELGFRGITLAEAVAHRDVHGSWPDQCAVLTFDDGYLNFEEHALTVLSRYDFAATLFIVSGHAGGWNDWAPPPPRLGTRPLLSWKQVSELASAGIEIGAHSRTHPDLRHLSGKQLEQEIAGARLDIEQQTGQGVQSFAYPFGGVSHAVRSVVARQYQAACTTVLRRAGTESMHELPRVDMYYIRSREQLERLLRGQLDGYLAMRRWGRAIRRWL